MLSELYLFKCCKMCRFLNNLVLMYHMENVSHGKTVKILNISDINQPIFIKFLLKISHYDTSSHSCYRWSLKCRSMQMFFEKKSFLEREYLKNSQSQLSLTVIDNKKNRRDYDLSASRTMSIVFS